MKKILISFLIYASTGCNNISNKEDQKTKILKSNSDSIISKNFEGSWDWVNDNEISTFGIEIVQKGNIIEGFHCGISQSGNKIDCGVDGEKSLKGEVNGNVAKIRFKSYFSLATGEAELSWNNNKQLLWKIIKEPKGEYYLPRAAILKRK